MSFSYIRKYFYSERWESTTLWNIKAPLVPYSNEGQAELQASRNRGELPFKPYENAAGLAVIGAQAAVGADADVA